MQPAAKVSSPSAPVDALIADVRSCAARTKFAAVKALRILSEGAPRSLYPHFDFFSNLLRDENSILRWNAMLILGNLAAVDAEWKLGRILPRLLAPIGGPHLIDAGNAIRGATAIAEARPNLADRIARRIMSVERSTYDTAECRNIAIGHALEALDRLFPLVTKKRPLQLFASRQLENTRPGTRKKAARFLRKWPA